MYFVPLAPPLPGCELHEDRGFCGCCFCSLLYTRNLACCLVCSKYLMNSFNTCLSSHLRAISQMIFISLQAVQQGEFHPFVPAAKKFHLWKLGRLWESINKYYDSMSQKHGTSFLTSASALSKILWQNKGTEMDVNLEWTPRALRFSLFYY